MIVMLPSISTMATAVPCLIWCFFRNWNGMVTMPFSFTEELFTGFKWYQYRKTGILF